MEISQLVNCKAELLKGFSRIYGLNGYQIPADKDSIYKYMALKNLENDIAKSRITFVSPETWEDSFETRYYKLKNYKAVLSFDEPMIFCMCLTEKQAANEDAFWRRYAPQNDHLVKIHFNIEKFFKILDSFAVVHNAEVYVGEAIYTDKKQIVGITPQNNQIFFSHPFKLENYLSLMSLKRGAFKYENEIRIFIVLNEVNDDIIEYYEENKKREKLLFVKNSLKDNSHIGEVRVSPYPMATRSQ